mgnify:CR=1 FL=1
MTVVVIGATAAAAAATVWCDALFNALSPPVKLWWPLFELLLPLLLLLLLLALALVFVVVVTALPPPPPAPAVAVPPVASLDGGGRYSGRSGRLFSASMAGFLCCCFCCGFAVATTTTTMLMILMTTAATLKIQSFVWQAKKRQWWEKVRGTSVKAACCVVLLFE